METLFPIHSPSSGHEFLWSLTKLNIYVFSFNQLLFENVGIPKLASIQITRVNCSEHKFWLNIRSYLSLRISSVRPLLLNNLQPKLCSSRLRSCWICYLFSIFYSLWWHIYHDVWCYTELSLSKELSRWRAMSVDYPTTTTVQSTPGVHGLSTGSQHGLSIWFCACNGRLAFLPNRPWEILWQLK